MDAEIRALWAAAGVTPAPEATDAEMVRRLFLDLIGRVPTADEAAAYLRSDDPDRREVLVDWLLASPEYAEHWAGVYTTLLVGGDLRVPPPLRQGLTGWLADAFAENRPFDAIATELLTARGDVLAESPAGAYLVAHARGGGPEKIAGQTARVFLGLQLHCAQCHDHPYDDRYKQEDFYGLVAYFTATRARPRRDEDGVRHIVLADLPPWRAQRRPAVMKRPDGEEVLVSPRLLGREIEGGLTRRDALARGILASDLFAKAHVNRTWAQLFGRGLVEPWDDLGGEGDPDHPRLLALLADELRESGYDHKRLLRRIVLSEAYRRSSRGPVEGAAAAERAFARAAVRPLGAEPLFRSLVTATGIRDFVEEHPEAAELERGMRQALREYTFVFGDDEMEEIDRFGGNVPQALVLFNGPLTHHGSQARAALTVGRILAAVDAPSDRLDGLYLAAFSRVPDPGERSEHLAYLASRQHAREAYEDLFFAMLSSTEFVTNH